MEINKDNLYQKYIIENHSLSEMENIFKIPQYKVSKCLKSFSIKKPPYLQQIVRINSIKKKYGVENISQLDFVKEHKKINPNINSKESIEKGIKTRIERYGNACNSKKGQETKKERYGISTYNNREKFKNTKNSWSDEFKKEVRKKIEKTSFEKYGVTNVLKLERVKGLGKKAEIKKYGKTFSQLHLPNTTLEIISCKEKLEKYILSQEN